jgi:hypothetical protein
MCVVGIRRVEWNDVDKQLRGIYKGENKNERKIVTMLFRTARNRKPWQQKMNNIIEFGHHTSKQADPRLLNCLCIFSLHLRLICTLRLSLPPTIVKCFFKNKSKNRKNNEKTMRLQISVRSKQKRKNICGNVSYRSACSVFLSNAHNIKKIFVFFRQ